MNKYNLFCTEEQTRKALELGAPIVQGPMLEILRNEIGERCFLSGTSLYWFPTAEEMIGWLEENNIENIIVCKKDGGDYGYTVYHTSHRSPLQRFWFSNRKEATLAAIDDALEYLISQKSNNNEN